MIDKNDLSRREALKQLGGAVGTALLSPLPWTPSGPAFASQSRPSSSSTLAGHNPHETIVVEPKEIDNSLVNPGRGFATTHNVYNEDIEDRRYPLSGVIQKRWYWDYLEPREGRPRFTYIDSVLAEAARNGQQVNFRVICQNIQMRIPQGAKEQGIKPPFYANPVFFDKQANLMKALGNRYDGNPNLAYIDIGTIGEWGEWHSNPKSTGIEMPAPKSILKIMDIYLDSFKKTPLLTQIGADKPGLQYGIKNGTGWRADCWGDMDPLQWNLMRRYPKMLTAAHANDAWKQGPVVFETCWTMSKWYKQGWDIDYILAWALQQHATEVNNKDDPIPEPWSSKVKEFEKKLGYRFVLKRLSYPAMVQAGEKMNYAMKWENKGVAPIYQRYALVCRFRPKNHKGKTRTVTTTENITRWMPGLSAIESEVKMPHDMPGGEYEMDIGIVKPGTDRPWIKLAIEGKTHDDWYKLGHIRIQ